MQITHFTQPENQENTELDLNNLKPFEWVIEKVVFDVEEKLDANIEKCFDDNYKGDDKIEALNKYRILWKYFDIYSEFKNHSFTLYFLNNSLKNFFVTWKKVSEEVVEFLYNKQIFSNLEDFWELAEEYIFININGEKFIENYEYIEKFLWRDLTKEDFEKNNFINFIKEWNTDNLEFLFREIKKIFYMSDYHIFNDIFFEEKNISEKVWNKEIDWNLIVDFCLQKWLGEKLEYLYKKKWEIFNIHNYFDSQFVKKWNNYISKSIINFKKSTNIITDKHPNIEISYYIIRLLDNIWENIFLFEEFNISYDYFKNMNIGWENEDTRFIDFLLNSHTKLLKYLIDNIDWIKFKDLFNIYKTDKELLINDTIFECFKYSNVPDSFLLLYEYSIKKWNYYFLRQNLGIFANFYGIWWDWYMWKLNCNNDKVAELLNKTWWFITRSLLDKYILVDDADLDEIWEKYQNAMKKVLSSEEIKKEELDDFLYEAIFMAYRPTWFSENDIKEMIENWKIEDLTHQLKNIKLNKQGYDLDFSKNELILEWEIKEEVLLYVNEVFKPLKKDPFINLNLKEFYSSSTEYIKILKKLNWFYNLNKDSRLEEFRININSDYISAYSNSNIAYNYLSDSFEIFWVVTKDSFPKYLKEELEKLEEEKIENIFGKIQKLKDPKFIKEFEEISRNNISDKVNILIEEKIKIISLLTEKRIIEFGSFMRKKIKKELKKFKIVRWGEKQFKAIISKNIWSFFAKAGAELCTSDNREMWEEGRHVHLNLIDEEKNQIVWNIMLYFEPERDYLVVRWFNPIKELINNYDKKTIINEMIRVVKYISKENWFDKVYIPKVNWKWHNLSNREWIQKLVWNESLKNINNKDYLIENSEFYETEIWGNKVDELYLL